MSLLRSRAPVTVTSVPAQHARWRSRWMLLIGGAVAKSLFPRREIIRVIQEAAQLESLLNDGWIQAWRLDPQSRSISPQSSLPPSYSFLPFSHRSLG